MQIIKTQFQNLDAWQLRIADGSQATITEAGAHLVSWSRADGQEQIYMSPRSVLASGQAIRGGVPVIFPQFTTRGNIVRHGFARLSDWQLRAQQASTAQASLTLGLAGNGEAWNWPHPHDCEMCFTLGPDTLTMALRVRNTGTAPLRFAAALHTYLQVGDASTVELRGLQGCDYEDSRDGNRRKTDSAPLVDARSGLDRVYLQTPTPLDLRSAHGRLELLHSGFPDAVVWNPGADLCPTIADLPPDAYREFICVEAALVGQPVTLAPGDSWQGAQQLTRRD